jgi:hypothetical protein
VELEQLAYRPRRRIDDGELAERPLPVSKAMERPSGDQPNTFCTRPGARARLLPPPAETRRSATVFPDAATYATFPPVGDHNG